MSYQAYLKEKDDLIEILKRHVVETMERKDDLFSSKPHSNLICSLLDSDDWKEVANRYVEENKQFKAQIARLTGKHQCVE